MKKFDDDLRRRMTDAANEHHETLKGMIGKEKGQYVRGVIDAATVVFGVYQDAEQPNGVGMHIIKGKRELQVAIASGGETMVTMDAVPCECLEQAIAAEQTWGDALLKAH
jgi:hypothetical protein